MAKAGRKTSVGKHIRDIIMDAHDKGASVRDIEKYLNEELDTSISKTTIQRIISSYKTSSEKIDKVEVGEDIKQVSVQKAKPAKNIVIADKMNKDYQTEVVEKVKPAITDKIYMDYMESLEDTDLLKALRYRYSYFARKNSMSFRQFVESACELEKQYLEKEVELAGNHNLTEHDTKHILEMAIIAKALSRL